MQSLVTPNHLLTFCSHRSLRSSLWGELPTPHWASSGSSWLTAWMLGRPSTLLGSTVSSFTLWWQSGRRLTNPVPESNTSFSHDNPPRWWHHFQVLELHQTWAYLTASSEAPPLTIFISIYRSLCFPGSTHTEQFENQLRLIILKYEQLTCKRWC